VSGPAEASPNSGMCTHGTTSIDITHSSLSPNFSRSAALAFRSLMAVEQGHPNNPTQMWGFKFQEAGSANNDPTHSTLLLVQTSTIIYQLVC